MNTQKIADAQVQKMIEQQRIKNLLVKDEKYFKWLADFVQKNGKTVSTDQFLYYPEKISEKDGSRLQKLCLFYEALSEYAQKNNIEETRAADFYGRSLNVKFENKVYEIGFLAGQGNFFFCKELGLEAKSAINFRDVINQNKNADKEL